MKRILYTVFGESKNLMDWSKDIRCKVKYSTLQKRIWKYKWPIEKAILEDSNGFGQLDLVGKKFGRLLVVSFNSISNTRNSIWNCKCECGKEKILSSVRLINGNTKSCGCLRSEIQKEKCKNRALPRGLAALNRVFYHYRRSASKRNLEWKLSKNLLKLLIFSNCFYCGQEPNNEKSYNKKQNGVIIRNGIDRIDSKIGYTQDNCVPCCKMCNLMKLNYTQEKFLNQIKKICQNKHL